ncbi:MAG: 2-C-methyl-D-erythritol 4-phosphate cytidylyltransferase [Candidatus Melainabacteria bacterium GWF2_37_15]|nr:MAG: 2-C-methyl-D-erythritol 4-phosphate cytidylyltransferase [Candidatus Melainabacteria bacterium GWF2_37_15]
MEKIYSIILASGKGERFDYYKPKQFIKIAGKTVLEHTLDIFEKNNSIDEIILVINPEYRALTEQIVINNHYKKITKILNGGETRKESSFIGINSINVDNAKVLIHDAVRPFVSDRIINECVEALDRFAAVDVAIKSADTIIQINDENIIENIPKRKYMMRGQTPQAFKVNLIKKAHELSAKEENPEFTDDCGLIVKYNLADVYVVNGEETNIKLTYPEDIFLADKLFQINSHKVPENVSLNALEDKIIVIFGASSGIGSDICKIARDYKAIVYGYSRKNNVDVINYDNVQNALKEVYEKENRIDFIINTAGVLNIGKLEERDIKSITEEININYIGAINVVKAGIEYLKQTKGSLLLFTSSSYTRGRALYSPYSSSKAAVVNLAQALAEEFLPDNVKINVMNPERTATAMRFQNFGKEPDGTLLNSEKVAIDSLKTVLSDLTGQVIDVRKSRS